MSETHYCDNYEELTGKERDNAPLTPAVQAKVVTAPKHAEPVAVTEVETKA